MSNRSSPQALLDSIRRLEQIHPTTDGDVTARAAQTLAARKTAAKLYLGVLALGALACAALAVRTPPDLAGVAYGALFGCVLLNFGQARRDLRLLRQVVPGEQDTPAELRPISDASLVALNEMSKHHPTLKAVVERWIDSGCPIRHGQFEAARDFDELTKQRRQQLIADHAAQEACDRALHALELGSTSAA